MAIEIKAPAFPESIADGEVAAWHKAEGEPVARDELIVEIETDKVVMEVVDYTNVNFARNENAVIKLQVLLQEPALALVCPPHRRASS